MKKLLLLIPLFLFSGFSYQTGYVPILMKRADLEASVLLVNSAKLITTPGKIYLYQNWIFLVEKYKGIHLIDNSDPAKPVRKAFLKVPGCMDVAVGNGILYVDNAVDLVGVRLNLNNMTATEVARKIMILPEIDSPYGYIPSDFSRQNRPASTEIVGWIQNSTYTNYSYNED